MILNKNIIPDSLFQKVIIGLILIFAGFSIWTSFTAFQHIQSMLNKDISPTSTEGMGAYSSNFSVHLKSFKFTKTANIDTAFTYVTLTDLTVSPSTDEAFEILTSASKNDKILGLSSHPSFFVSNEQRSFWKTQINLELGFLVGAFLTLIFAVIWLFSIRIDLYKKLFTKEIYRWVMTFFFILFAGFMMDALLYARKINFLNNEFNLGLSPTGGVSPTMMFVLFLLLFVLIFLRKAIPMQNEQDLTV